MRSPDSVRASTTVSVEPAEAFRIFTDEVDAWWQRSERYRFRAGHGGQLSFAGGERLIERASDGSEFVVGRVLAWEPPRRLRFEFRDPAFGDQPDTVVEVTFAAEGARTRVTVVHSGWSRLPEQHAARRGARGDAFHGMLGLYWGALLNGLQRHASR